MDDFWKRFSIVIDKIESQVQITDVLIKEAQSMAQQEQQRLENELEVLDV